MKRGIDFFPLDVSLDEKFELLEAEFGLIAFGVVVKIFQKIYGGQGYYIEWTKEVAFLFARKNGLGGNVVSEIVSASIRRGIFDKEMYEKYRILTSVGIQKRYFGAISRRLHPEVDERYLLVPYAQKQENDPENVEKPGISDENVNISEHSKVKYSRVYTNAQAREKRKIEKPIGFDLNEFFDSACIGG